MAVRHGKMTEPRKEEILLMCKNLCHGTTKKVDFKEVNIEMTCNTDNYSDIDVDLAVIFIIKSVDGKQIEASIATAVAKINGASKGQLAVAQQYCLDIITTALDGLQLPKGQAKEDIIKMLDD